VTLAFLFWLLMILWLILSFALGWSIYPDARARSWGLGSGFLVWVLLALLGVAAFGWPIKG
jgi:hypothetical protein